MLVLFSACEINEVTQFPPFSLFLEPAAGTRIRAFNFPVYDGAPPPRVVCLPVTSSAFSFRGVIQFPLDRVVILAKNNLEFLLEAELN